MAPEVWTDETEGYSQPVDVYAYAVLLYSLFTPDPTVLLDDGKRKPRNISDLMKRIQGGSRFKRVPEINDHYWGLITGGWDKAAARRPTFRQIVDLMIANLPAFLFPGAVEADVRDYITKMIRYR
jgi:hypothetical protein